jgi:hypothetical protein
MASRTELASIKQSSELVANVRDLRKQIDQQNWGSIGELYIMTVLVLVVARFIKHL